MIAYRTILAAHDFSPCAQRALAHAVALRERSQGELHLFHGVPPPLLAPAAAAGGVPPAGLQTRGLLEEARREAEASLARVARALDCPAQLHVVAGAPADAICETARAIGADLIVMGTHGRTGLAHLFLGSVAERTVRRAPCPVLAVPAPEEDESRSEA